MDLIVRLLRAGLAGVGTAVVVVLVYAVVDLYMAGHGKGWTPERGNPWYYHLFTVLMLAAAAIAAVATFRRR